jgi:hypothetical protein
LSFLGNFPQSGKSAGVGGAAGSKGILHAVVIPPSVWGLKYIKPRLEHLMLIFIEFFKGEKEAKAAE